MALDGSPDRAGDGEEEGARRREIAEHLFAEWLVEHPRPTSAEFEAFQGLHARQPGVAGELGRLWRGLRRYDELRRAIRSERSEHDDATVLRPPASLWKSWRWRGSAAAAAIVLALTTLTIRERELDRNHLRVELAQAAAAPAIAYASLVKSDTAEVVLGLAPPSPGTLPLEGIPVVQDRAAETVSLLRGAEELANETKDRFFLRAADRTVAVKTASECASWLAPPAPVTAPQEMLRNATSESADASFLGSPIAMTLRTDVRVQELFKRFGGARGLPAALRRAIGTAMQEAPASIRVFDLDDDGDEVTGASIVIQETIFPTNELGAPRLLGKSPWIGSLPAGDLRITVVAADGLRFSELRVLALPGVDVGPRVAFLRATDAVTAAMANKPAARISFAGGSIPGRGYPPSPIDCDVLELWVDPYEATKALWSDFHRDVDANRDRWFEGVMPIGTLAFLDAAGNCPTAIADHPVTVIDFDDALLFANWAGKRLPTEREWERIAKGADERTFPWGGTFIAGAVDESNSIETLLLQGRPSVTAPRTVKTIDDLPGAKVDDPAYANGATPATDGDPVWRLGDNASELVEDLWIERAADGSYAYAFVDDFLRISRGAGYLFAGSRGSQNRSAQQFVAKRMTFHKDKGIRLVKSALPAHVP